MIHRISLLILLLAALSAEADDARAELLPDEVAIIVARGSRDSEGLAKYYAQQRGIPLENICAIDMPRGETLNREQWQWAVRPEIHKWIVENDPDAKLKCLVTTFDVPLKISSGPVADLEVYGQFLAGERSVRVEQLGKIVEAFNEIASDAPSAESEVDAEEPIAEEPIAEEPVAEATQAEETKSADDDSTVRLEQALQAAQRRVAKLSDADREKAQLRVQKLASVAGGVNVLLGALGQRLQDGSKLPDSARIEFGVFRGQAATLAEAKGLLERTAPSPERDAMILALVDRAGGITASIKWLDEQLAAAQNNETGASFDSELSLVMWDDGYQLLRWQPNYLRSGYDNSQLGKIRRTLMVARIDAPTVALAKGLVDQAIKVEKEGLQGAAYFDARGLAKLDETPHSVGSFGDFDKALLLTAKGIEEQTDIDVVLNDKPALFQPGECPNAAIYCGWYSLGKYVDAFEWSPGAVAYHLASSEAATLRDAESQVWCKRMLEDGVAATIGPVYEPYLLAFPRPEEFFAHLLRGELTLVECYYRTQPLNSWMMTLIGDPLYRPFKSKPMANVGVGGMEPPPGTAPAAAEPAAAAAP